MGTGRRSLSTMLGVLALGAVLGAVASVQDPAVTPAQPVQPTFRTDVDLVRVDVTVTDRDGEPVLDLGPQDFEIRQDDIPQTIESFQLVQLDGEQPPDDDLSLPIRSRDHGEAEARREDVRIFVIFLNDYHVSRGRETLVLREALADFVREDLGPTDLVALMDPLTPLSALEFTRDRAEVARTIERFEGRRGIYVPPRSVIEEAHLQSRNIGRIRLEVTLSALKALVTYLGGLRDGRKSVLFASSAFEMPFDLAGEFRDVYRTASHNNTAVYPVDPRGLGFNRSGFRLQELADETGGLAIVNTNNVRQPLTQVVRDASAHYLIGFATGDLPSDGKFREIDVRVRRDGVRVRARRGYWAQTDIVPQEDINTPPDVPPQIAEVLATLDAPVGRFINVWIGSSRASSDRTRVTIAWNPRHTGATEPISRVEIGPADGHVAPLVDPATHATADGSGATIFEAAPGALRLRIKALNRQGATIDDYIETIEVPDLWHAPVVLSTPEIFRFADAAAAGRTVPERLPLVTREFLSDERLLVRFEAFGTLRPVQVSASFLNRQGQELVVLPVQAMDAPGGYQIDLPLGSFGRGDYLLRIEATSGGEMVDHLVPVRVGG